MTKLGMVLASITVGVGAAAAIIAVQAYYTQETIRDILLQKRLKEAFSANHFIVDRIIDGDCLGNPLFVGVHKQPNKFNPMSSQGIRLGENASIKRMVSFSTTKSGGLLYIFEDGTSLSFENGKYTYNSQSGPVVDKTFDATKYKPIGLDVAAELDVIAKLR